MNALIDRCYRFHRGACRALSPLEGLGPLALRLYLVPVFWIAGTTKLAAIDSIAPWFASLGLPAPTLMAWLATLTEVIGAAALLAGFAVRWVTVPLMITMVVAAVTVHWPHGWAAIADSSAPDIAVRLDRARAILQHYGNYDWLTARGGFVILNNGIEFAATYFVMLLALFFSGGGRYVSIDYWLDRYLTGRARN